MTWRDKARVLIGQLMRYGVVGVLVYLSDFGTFSLVVLIQADYYQEANVLGRVVGALLGFFLHKHFTFGDVNQAAGVAGQLFRYISLLIGNIVLSIILLSLMVKGMQIDLLLARLVVDGLVIALSFLVSRFFVFKEARHTHRIKD